MYIGNKEREKNIMAQSTFLNDPRILLAETEEDIVTIAKAANEIHKEFNFCSSTTPAKTEEYSKIFRQTTLSLKKFANSHYKTTAALEPTEIEQIKACLNNYACDDERVAEFKKQIIDDLSTFQAQIKVSYTEKIAEYHKKRQFCEKQIRVYEYEKNRIIMDRLSKIVWPYDEKTKDLDNKIATLQVQIQQYTNKAKTASQMRPAANEKEILLYEMQLKEKFSKLINAA